MKCIALLTLSLVAASTVFAAAPVVTTNPPGAVTRNQVRMERDEFLRTHIWNETSDIWSLKAGVEPPTGVKSRSEVKAARDAFLSNNKWDESRGGWQALGTAPREVSKLSRETVRLETRAFMRTHRWDEPTEAWVERAVSAKSK